MGKIKRFLNQGANTAMDRMATPVVSSLLSRRGRLFLYLWYARLGNLLQIGRQVITDYNKRIDLLAVDGQGPLCH